MSGAKRTEGLSGVRGRENSRMDLGAKGLLIADGMGQGIKSRTASQRKEGFFSCGTATVPLPPPTHSPHPPSCQEITVSKEIVPNQATMKKAWPMPKDLLELEGK